MTHMAPRLSTAAPENEKSQLVEAYVQVDRVCRGVTSGSRTLGQNDMWIASTALLCDLPLITTDKDFLPLHERLITVYWVDAQES
jgi:predicted nucleic acid-binding protein